MNKKAVLSKETTILNELGMHARPAAKIAQIAMDAAGEVWLTNGDVEVDASSIIDILTLGAIKGTSIEIHVETTEDEDVLDRIKAFFDEGFGELNNES